MDYKVFIPVLISFVLSVILGPLIIPVLRRLKMDQTEREDGVQSHLKKTGTPTMGGVMILLAVVITSVIYIGRYPKIIPILFLTQSRFRWMSHRRILPHQLTGYQKNPCHLSRTVHFFPQIIQINRRAVFFLIYQ